MTRERGRPVGSAAKRQELPAAGRERLQRFVRSMEVASTEGSHRWKDAYGDEFNRVYDVCAANGFYGRQEFYGVGAIRAGTFMFSGVDYSRRVRIPEGDEQPVCLQINVAGGATGEYGGRSFSTGPGEAMLIDRTLRGGHRTEARNAGMMIALPPGALPPSLREARRVLTLEGPRAGLLYGFARWLQAELPRATAANVPTVERSIHAVVAACFERQAPLSPEARDALGRAAVSRAMAFIEARCMTPLEVEAVAAAALVSRATLYRLFKPLGGVAEAIWRARLERARRLLSDPAVEGSIGDVADLCGFATAQHFSQRFKAEYGFSPRNLRPF